MKSSTIPSHEEILTWFTQNHVTITFTTATGSHYTLVVRPGIAVLVKDNAAQAWKGTHVRVGVDGGVVLCNKDREYRTTKVVSYFIATN